MNPNKDRKPRQTNFRRNKDIKELTTQKIPGPKFHNKIFLSPQRSDS